MEAGADLRRDDKRMKALLLVIWLAVAGNVCAEDDTWLIVPGKSVGKIAIGMEQSEVFKLLGTPTMQNNFAETNRRASYLVDRRGEVPIPKGLTQSDWTTPLPVPGKDDAVGYLCDFVTVYVLDKKVVQIEVRVRRFHDAHGLSSASTAVEWRRQYAPTDNFYCECHHPSAEGIPALQAPLVLSGRSARHGVYLEVRRIHRHSVRNRTRMAIREAFTPGAKIGLRARLRRKAVSRRDAGRRPRPSVLRV